MPNAAAATAMCQICRVPRSPRTAIVDTAITLTVSTAMMIVRWLIRSAAIPPIKTNATRPAPRHVATSDSDVGSLDSSMT